MTDSPQQRPPIEPIAYLVLLTDTVYLFEDRQLFELTGTQLLFLKLLQIGIIHDFKIDNVLHTASFIVY